MLSESTILILSRGASILYPAYIMGCTNLDAYMMTDLDESIAPSLYLCDLDTDIQILMYIRESN